MDTFTSLHLSGSDEKTPRNPEGGNIGTRFNNEECFDVDLESCEFLDGDQQPNERESLNVLRAKDITSDSEEEGDCEDLDIVDEDIVEKAVDPPPGCMRIRPSKFNMIPATVFVEYPQALGIIRSDVSTIESLQDKELRYRCRWARNCIKNAFTRAGFEESSQNWTVTWAQHQTPFTLRGLNCLQKVNHFPGSWALGRKDRLSRCIWSMKRVFPTEFNFHPESFVLPVDKHCLERCAKADVFHNKSVKHSKQKRFWIMKPVASSCGKGIKVITAEKALTMCKSNERKVLVQRYLSDPYLINKKKFDMRLYVLVTGVDPLRIYLHDEGLIRMATENFSVKSLKNPFIHLTNYSINKRSKHFCASSQYNFDVDKNKESSPSYSESSQGRDGFKWTLNAFKAWLAEVESPSIMEQTMTSVRSLIVKTILAAEPHLTHSLHASANYRTNCFELFGFDVFLDSCLVPHLIEVNVSPSLAGSSPLDTHIKGVLVADVCHVTGFHAHDDALLDKYPSAQSSNLSNNNININNNGSSGGALPGTRPASAGPATVKVSSNTTEPPASIHSDEKVKNRTKEKEKDEVNPFSFASLSQLMAGQAEWRKEMAMRNINLESLSHADAAWYMLLMVEDEFDRAESSKFQRLHPVRDSIEKYMALYKNARFSDQLLGRWIKGGMSKGKENNNYLPRRFKKSVEKGLLNAAELTKEVRVAFESAGEATNGLHPRGTGVALARAQGRFSLDRSMSEGATGEAPKGGEQGLALRTKSAGPSLSDQSPLGELPAVQVQHDNSKIPSYQRADRFSNLKDNLRQHNICLYDPVQRKMKTPKASKKINRKNHTSVVFEPSSRQRSCSQPNNANVIGDMYRSLLHRNMQVKSSGLLCRSLVLNEGRGTSPGSCKQQGNKTPPVGSRGRSGHGTRLDTS